MGELFDKVAVFVIVGLYIAALMTFGPPTPAQLCRRAKRTLAKTGNSGELYSIAIADMAILLKKYLLNDDYCRDHGGQFGKLFKLLAENSDLAEAIFGDIELAHYRMQEIKKMPGPDPDCGCSSSGHAR